MLYRFTIIVTVLIIMFFTACSSDEGSSFDPSGEIVGFGDDFSTIITLPNSGDSIVFVGRQSSTTRLEVQLTNDSGDVYVTYWKDDIQQDENTTQDDIGVGSDTFTVSGLEFHNEEGESESRILITIIGGSQGDLVRSGESTSIGFTGLSTGIEWPQPTLIGDATISGQIDWVNHSHHE